MLLVCIGSHISELLDTWDNTFQTGNDIESVVLVLALTVGAALALAPVGKLLVAKTRSLAVASAPFPLQQSISEVIFPTHSPPLLSLRI